MRVAVLLPQTIWFLYNTLLAPCSTPAGWTLPLRRQTCVRAPLPGRSVSYQECDSRGSPTLGVSPTGQNRGAASLPEDDGMVSPSGGENGQDCHLQSSADPFTLHPLFKLHSNSHRCSGLCVYTLTSVYPARLSRS